MNTVTRSLLSLIVAFGAAHAAAASTVSLTASPYQKPGPGDDVVVAATIDQVSGVTSMDLSYTYDPARMTPTGAFRTALTNNLAMTSDLATPGVVALHFTGSSSVTGSGDLAWVTFRLAQGFTPGSTTPMSWVSASFNGDATTAQKKGTMMAVGSATATIATPRNAYGAHGSQVQIPILVSSMSSGSSFDLVLMYDPSVLAPVTVQKTSLTSCMTMNANTLVPGTIRVSMFGICTLSGSGSLVQVTFNVLGPDGSRTPLNVTRGAIDEEGTPTVLEDGLFNTCGSPDIDGDGYSVCAGDCNEANAAIHPGALEICNGIDDDCDGVVNDVAAPQGIPAIVFDGENGDTRLSWAAVPTASGYDVVRGYLGALVAGTGNFSQSTDACLASNASSSTIVDDSIPAEDDGFWYLVRPRNCGGIGSFDETGYGQAASRDAGIDASASSCP